MLNRSSQGHSSADAVALIRKAKDLGFDVGVILTPGIPEYTVEKYSTI